MYVLPSFAHSTPSHTHEIEREEREPFELTPMVTFVVGVIAMALVSLLYLAA